MCITSGEANLSDTSLYGGRAVYKDKDVHVLAYQNTAESSGPNSMILPFPTEVSMTQDNIIDTSLFPKFLKNINDATKQQMRSLGMSRGVAMGCAGGAQVFDSGSYTVILAEKASQIPAALEQVPSNKRPVVSLRFLMGFQRMYPGQPIAVCCWDGMVKAEPLLWWYEPKNKDHLFLPTMDAHDGEAPRLGARVRMDHIISVGSQTNPGRGSEVYYQEKIPEAYRSLLPKYVYGTKMDNLYMNGDTFFELALLDGKIDNHKKHPLIVRGESYDKAKSYQDSFHLHGWS